MRRSKGDFPPLLEKVTYGLAFGLAAYLLFAAWWLGAPVVRAFFWPAGSAPAAARPVESHGLVSSGTGDAVGVVLPLKLARVGAGRSKTAPVHVPAPSDR